MKKSIALILAAIMLCSVLAAPAFAQSYVYKKDTVITATLLVPDLNRTVNAVEGYIKYSDCVSYVENSFKAEHFKGMYYNDINSSISFISTNVDEDYDITSDKIVCSAQFKVLRDTDDLGLSEKLTDLYCIVGSKFIYFDDLETKLRIYDPTAPTEPETTEPETTLPVTTEPETEEPTATSPSTEASTATESQTAEPTQTVTATNPTSTQNPTASTSPETEPTEATTKAETTAPVSQVTEAPTSTEATTAPVSTEPTEETTEPTTSPKTEPSETATADPTSAPTGDPTAPPTVAPTTSVPEPTTAPATTLPAIKKVSKGAAEKQVNTFVAALKDDKDISGSSYGAFCAKQKKSAKTSITISWSKPKSASYFVIYANKCSKQYKKLKAQSKTTFKVTGLKKATYYKFLIIAFDKSKKCVASSGTLHIATAGGKAGNAKSIKITSPKKSTQKLKKGKKLKLKATQLTAGKKQKIKNHRKLSFESSNPKIAAVTSKGVINAKKKGTAKIFVYAQNGVCKTLTIKVK